MVIFKHNSSLAINSILSHIKQNLLILSQLTCEIIKFEKVVECVVGALFPMHVAEEAGIINNLYVS